MIGSVLIVNYERVNEDTVRSHFEITVLLQYHSIIISIACLKLNEKDHTPLL